jgi:hypothetical protein
MINYKSKDPEKELNDILQDNYWIEELDHSVVKLLFNSLSDKQSFLDICGGVYFIGDLSLSPRNVSDQEIHTTDRARI